MPNRMPDTPFMIGANGMIADVSFNGFAQGYATVGQQPVIATGETPNLGNAPSPGPWGVTQLLPGSLVQLTGAVKAQGAPSGSAIASGTPLQLRLFWDSTGLLLSAYTAFLINGTPQAVGAVSSAWASFSPVAVLYGRGAQGFSTYTTFLGRFNKVQAGNSPIPTNSQIIPSRTSP